MVAFFMKRATLKSAAMAFPKQCCVLQISDPDSEDYFCALNQLRETFVSASLYTLYKLNASSWIQRRRYIDIICKKSSLYHLLYFLMKILDGGKVVGFWEGNACHFVSLTSCSIFPAWLHFFSLSHLLIHLCWFGNRGYSISC